MIENFRKTFFLRVNVALVSGLRNFVNVDLVSGLRNLSFAFSPVFTSDFTFRTPSWITSTYSRPGEFNTSSIQYLVSSMLLFSWVKYTLGWLTSPYTRAGKGRGNYLCMKAHSICACRNSLSLSQATQTDRPTDRQTDRRKDRKRHRHKERKRERRRPNYCHVITEATR